MALHLSRLCLAVVLLALASLPRTAHAATLTLVMDSSSFSLGDTITIRLVGDSQGGTDKTLWAAVEIDRSVLLGAHADTFMPQTTGAILVQGAARGCEFFFSRGLNRCGLMNMVDSNPYPPGFSIDPSTEPFTYAVLTATAGALGVHTLDFTTSPVSQRVDFFGLTSAPGVTFTVHAPEPTTGALLALGLGGTALARRRRVRH